jgi:LysM repeat protein
MKKILFAAFLAVAVVTPGFAQDAATQQQIEKLSGQIQDLLDAQAQQGKRLDALEKEISDLRDKVNTPVAAPDTASAAEVKKLAEQLQEVDQKRHDDVKMIAKQIEKLGKVVTGAPMKIKTSGGVSTTATTGGNDTPAPNVPKTGYYYVVKDGDTLSGIAKTYRESEKHVKVSVSQILAANPGLDATKLYTGKKIFIPDANAQ